MKENSKKIFYNVNKEKKDKFETTTGKAFTKQR